MDRQQLRERCEAGDEFTYLFFWGHTVTAGKVTKTCFSQWYPAAFEIDGIDYATAEHWMMAAKARLFNDEEILEQILVAPDPKSAKALGRKVGNFDDAVWKGNARRLVTEGNIAKFTQNLPLREVLLASGASVIVEAAPRDCIWGIGLSEGNEKSRDPRTWRGQNLLGFALMDVRDHIRGLS